VKFRYQRWMILQILSLLYFLLLIFQGVRAPSV